VTPVDVSETVPDGWAELAAERGTFYHDPAWIAAIGDCYRYPVRYLTCRSDGRLVGGLALALVPRLVGRHRLVSFPFSYAAGAMAADPDVQLQLAAAAVDLGRRLRSHRVELKQVGDAAPAAPGFVRSTHYSTYRVDTAGGEAAVWKRLHAASTQRGIKKGEKSGVRPVVGDSESDWQTMATLEELTARRHGVPAPPRRFFIDLCRQLQQRGLATLLLARLATGEVAAGIVLWKGRTNWIYAFGASVPALLAVRPNHVLLWRAMQDAIAAGVTFDLGRAAPEQTGLVEFKTRWGGVPTPLAYDYWPSASGLNVARRDRGVLGLGAAVWSRLPAAVTRWGSGLYRYLG
jgi:hypothetical protein